MNNIGRVVFYTTQNGDRKAHIFYTNGIDKETTEREAQEAVIEIAKQEGIKNNEQLEAYKNSKNSRFIVKKSVENEEEFLNGFKYYNDNVLKAQNVNVNREAFPVAGSAKLTREDFEDEYDDDKKSSGKIRTLLSNIGNKIKRSRLGVKITALALAGVMAIGLYSCSHRKSMDGEIANNNITYNQTESAEDNNNVEVADTTTAAVTTPSVTTPYEKLLAQSTSLKQREAMQMMSDNLDYYNVRFANSHMEDGKNIKACITWDEMMALQFAVNDYTDEEIRDLFPQLKVGSNFVSQQMKNYNNANLQLVKSYAIETSESRVNAYRIVESTEGQAFIKKYEDMFFAAKESTGSEKLELVKKFYDSVRKEFNLNTNTSYKQYPSYYQLVSNIVSAAEMMYQNLDVDYTLNDEELARFQAINLCEIAHDKIANHLYKIVESTQIYCYGSKDGGSKDGNDSTIYDQFREEKIKELKDQDNYFVSEERRDISKYDEFIKTVNKEVECFTYYNEGSGKKIEENCVTKTDTKNEKETSSRTETKTTYETKTTVIRTDDREEAIRKSSKEQIEKAESEVDCQIEKENEQRRIEAENQAEENRKRLQQEADEQARKNEEEVRKDQEDLQNKIDEANKKIENGETINEKDLEHDVKFDDNHSDENGNLDNSVKDITTDGTGANEPLPDPNETGAEFDKKAPASTKQDECDTSSNTNNSSSSNSSSSSSSSSENSSSSGEGFYTEEVTTTTEINTNTNNNNNSNSSSSSSEIQTPTTITTSGKQSIIEYEEPIDAPLTNEQLVDAYINSLENSANVEDYKTLTK